MPSKPKPIKMPKVKRLPVEKQRRKLERQIEDVAKLIIAWRDGQECVLKTTDGARCGNGLMWNHVIGQKQSRWLRLDLGNIFWGCGNHNMLDFHGDKTLFIWYTKTFGIKVVEAMQSEKMSHAGQKYQLHELETMLAEYDELYQNRYYTRNDSIQDLVNAGYYGRIVGMNYLDI
jgi:hypothetical protein